MLKAIAAPYILIRCALCMKRHACDCCSHGQILGQVVDKKETLWGQTRICRVCEKLIHSYGFG